MTGMTSAVDTTANARTVETFLYALQDEDFDTADSLMADNIAVAERRAATDASGAAGASSACFRRGEGRVGFEVKFHRIAADGNAVLTERTDALIIGPLRLQFWVCGVFEVHGGRITLWRDYFDKFDFLVKAPLRGLLRRTSSPRCARRCSYARLSWPSSSNACAHPVSRSVALTSSSR